MQFGLAPCDGAAGGGLPWGRRAAKALSANPERAACSRQKPSLPGLCFLSCRMGSTAASAHVSPGGTMRHHAGASPCRQHGIVNNNLVRRLHRWGRRAGLPEALGALQPFGEGTSSCSPAVPPHPSTPVLSPQTSTTPSHFPKTTPLTCPLKDHSKPVLWPKPLFLAVPVPLPGRRAQSLQAWSFFHIVTAANV